MIAWTDRMKWKNNFQPPHVNYICKIHMTVYNSKYIHMYVYMNLYTYMDINVYKNVTIKQY